VIALRVPPDEVRELYHAWLVGLWAGELQRPEPALPMRHTDQDVVRRVTREQLAELLAALPAKQSTRISLAREIGEHMVHQGADKTDMDFVEYRTLTELGGFVATGPTAISAIKERCGAGEHRVSAYGSIRRGCGGRCSLRSWKSLAAADPGHAQRARQARP
jgi:hypothetical protein